MSSFLTDKSLELESRFGGWASSSAGAARNRTFAKPGVAPHYTPDRTYAITHVSLDLQIDPVAKTLIGTARLRFSRLAGQDGPFVLHLEDLVVDSIEGVPTWRHADGRLEIPPADEVVVRYHGSPRRGLYFVGATLAEPERLDEAWTQCQDQDARYVFPCFDHPSVKHPFSIRITAPEGYGVLSNGRFVGRDGGAWIWEQAEPISPYLFTAVVMKMDVVEASSAGVPLRYVVPTGTDPAAIERAFGRTPAMMAFLSRTYGAFPWARYDQVVVHDFIFGGMENVAATTLTDLVLTDVRAAIDWDADDLVVHEMAHQWFGDLLTCQDWSQGWLNEGWATYTEHLWAAEARSQDEADQHLFEQLGNYLGEDGGRYRRPIVTYNFRAPIDLFDRHLYEKAALVLHTLRHWLGDEAFFGGVHLYLARHAHGVVHTRHFQRALEDATGRNLDRFFQQWIYGAGHPTLEVAVAHADGMLSVTVKQTQEGDAVAKEFHFPLVLHVGDQRVVLSVDARERTFVLPCAVSPSYVRVDSEFRLLAEIKVKGPRSWWMRALKEDPGVVGRIRAARALAEDAGLESIGALCSALVDDPWWGVRAEVADLLGVRGGDRAASALIGALKDPHPKARRRIVAALGGLHRPDVALALGALDEDVSLQVEGERVRSLARLRAAGARAACEAVLSQPSWSEILRARGLEGLGQLRDVGVLATLLDWTTEIRPPRARMAACAALARLGDDVEAARLPAVERLIQLAEDPNFRVQVSAINALGTLRDARAMTVLQRVHASASDGRCRRLAWEAMGSVRDGRTTEAGLSGLRKELEGLVEENRKLRDRVVRLEEKKAGA